MKVLVYGGSASGKSELAESISVEYGKKNPEKKMMYLATLDENSGGDTTERIKRHRKMRQGKGFSTFVLSLDSKGLNLKGENEEHLSSASRFSVILLEDLGNLVARVIFSSENYNECNHEKYVEKIMKFLDFLSGLCENFVIVSNDIFLEEINLSDTYMKGYYKILSEINNKFSSVCDKLIQVVAGLSIEYSKN